MKSCPVDKSELKRVKYEFCMIRQCPTCLGTLLTEDKVNRFKRKQETSSDELKSKVDEISSEDTKHQIRCPNCKFRMQKQKVSKQDFSLDHCPACKSIWLDGGELEKIELDFQLSRLGKEQGKTYVSYNKLSRAEKKAYVRAVALSQPDQAQMFFGAIVSAVVAALSSALRRHWLYR